MNRLALLAAAGLLGAIVGISTVGRSGSAIASTLEAARPVAAAAGTARRNDPPPGAYYAGCNEARAAGVTPLYAGEPGYREGMDGDGDGIACEPYRGRR